MVQQYGLSLRPKIVAQVIRTTSPNGEFTKETDIMDVWLDLAVHIKELWHRPELEFPETKVLEGSDQ